VRWRDESGPGRGLTLHVRRVVEPVAPPVLLLHGLGVGGSVWQPFARRLLPHLAAVAPDLRGHGQSDAPPSGYAPPDYAADLIQLIEDRIEPPVPVVGHSLGALVAANLAQLRPDLVRWLVLLDPPLDPDLRNPEIGPVYRLRHAPPGELEAYLLDRNPNSGQLLAQTLASLFRQASDAAFEAPLSQPALPDPTTISQPTLVLQADPDYGGVLGDAAARAFVERLPNGRLQKVVGATHSLHASHPAGVARAILEFGGYSTAPSLASR
jgi:pimeloyl-ACP methyl ester carboxylesterase